MGSEKVRVHSSIDKLPKELVKAIQTMCVDNGWPDDFSGEKKGKPRYEDIVDYCQQKGHTVHVSSIGRYCRRLATYSHMKDTGQLVRSVMESIQDQNVSETQKAASELLTARIIERLVDSDQLKSKDICDLSRAAKDCNTIVIQAHKYIQQQVKERLERSTKKAANNIQNIGNKKQIAPETLKAIKEQVYGILDDHLKIA